MDKETKALAKELRAGAPPLKQPKPGDFVSTGSTLLNLGCSGRPFGGLAKGYYYFVVGDSSALKTWLSLNCLAEAANNPRFDKYRLVFDPVEQGALMDVSKFFGRKLSERMRPPPLGVSGTAEEFYYNLDELFKKGKPFIYVLDSADALVSEQSVDKFEENKTAYLKGNDGKGSYGDGKAKLHSENMRLVCQRLQESGSILIVLAQTRDNINAIGWADKKTRGGGKALRFYATLEMWNSVMEKIRKDVRGRKRTIGSTIIVKFRKNRFCGFEDEVKIDHYRSYGIDDIGSNVKFLLEEGHWKKVQGYVDAKEFKFRGNQEALVAFVEARGLEKDLAMIVAEVWEDIQAQSKIERKPRYE